MLVPLIGSDLLRLATDEKTRTNSRISGINAGFVGSAWAEDEMSALLCTFVFYYRKGAPATEDRSSRN